MKHNNTYKGVGHRQTEETKRKLRAQNIGKKHSLETRKKMSITRQGNQNCLGHRHSSLTRLKMSLAKIGNKYNTGRGHTLSKETRLKISQRMMGHGFRGTEESKRKTAESMTRVWSNPEYKSKVLKAIIASNHRGPTKPEQQVLDAIKEHNLPFSYNGNNGDTIIAGKCPDFISKDGLKCVIEVAGHYWHKPKYEQERVALFNSTGYKTLVLWDSNIIKLNSAEIAQIISNFLLLHYPTLLKVARNLV